MLGLSSTTLSLLIALVTLLALVGPQVRGWFTVPSDRMSFSIVTVDPDFNEVRVLATNAGERASAVRSVQVVRGGEKPLRISLAAPDGSLVASAGSSLDFAFYAAHELPRMIEPLEEAAPSDSSSPEEWEVIVTYIDSNGVQQQERRAFLARVTETTGRPLEPLRIRTLELFRYEETDGPTRPVLSGELGDADLYLEVGLMAPLGGGPESEVQTVDRVRIGDWEGTWISLKMRYDYGDEEDVVYVRGVTTLSAHVPRGRLHSAEDDRAVELDVALIDAWGQVVATATLEVPAKVRPPGPRQPSSGTD